MMDGGPRDLQLARESGLAARQLDSSVSRFPREAGEVIHAGNVEDFSTTRKRFSRGLLYIEMKRISACFGPMSETQHKQDIGARLRLVREALGYGLREFARKHQLDPTKLNHWEKGKHYPDPAFIRLLWDEHNVTADWVYLDRKGGLPRELADSLDAVLAAYAAGKPGAEPQEGASGRGTKAGTPRKLRLVKPEHS